MGWFRWIFRKSKRYLRSKFLYNNSESSLRNIMGFVKDNRIAGDYIEFGVYRGHSLRYAWEMAEEMKIDWMSFYGFDSFQGMPDTEENGNISEGDYSCSIEEVRKNLKRWGTDKHVYLIKGWYKDIKIPDETAEFAVVNFDCDYYDSTRDALRLIKPYLKDGMVMRFDDWLLYRGRADMGQQKAFAEFREEIKDVFYFTEMFDSGTGKVFIVHKRKKGSQPLYFAVF